MSNSQKGTIKTLPVQTMKKDGTPMNKWTFRIDVPDDKYPQVIEFSIFKKTYDNFNFKIGDPVVVTFKLCGREWGERCFIDAVAFFVEEDKEFSMNQSLKKAMDKNEEDSEEDSLPF